MEPKDRIIVALDVSTAEEAAALAAELKGAVGAFKIGKELFTAVGPEAVRRITAEAGEVFLDLKYHDIPNTVKGACRAAAGLGAFMINVHAAGGSAMLKAAAEGAAEGAQQSGKAKPYLLAVTVLTSIDQDTLNNELRIDQTAADQVAFWAELAQKNGADGVVCSPKEIEVVRKVCGGDFLIVTPGVRPAWASKDDQKRITTPADAVARGADYLVIGRPITKAEDRRAAAVKIAEELEDTE